MHGNNTARIYRSPYYGNAQAAAVWGDAEVAAGRKHPRPKNKQKEITPGRYKTTNGLKESVLEEIYEAELCGDITPEERMALIDYMDI